MAEDEETEEAEPEEKASIKETIIEVLHDLGITGGAKSEPEVTEPAKTESVEEIESPRQQESRMRREVESAVGGLHIHLDGGKSEEKEKAKSEPEATPGKKPFLARMIGLDS